MTIDSTPGPPSNSTLNTGSGPSAEGLRRRTIPQPQAEGLRRLTVSQASVEGVGRQIVQPAYTMQPSTQAGGAQPQQPMLPLEQHATGNATLTTGRPDQAAVRHAITSLSCGEMLIACTDGWYLSYDRIQAAQLREELVAWVMNSEVPGKKIEAAQKIYRCFFFQKDWLSLSTLELGGLPESIGRLTQLKTLFLHDNRLTSLPESIVQLTNLTTLSVQNNQLTSLPENIGRLSQLECLPLFNNQLTSLPVTMGDLQNLHTLHIGDNMHLHELPLSLGQIPRLTHISCESRGNLDQQIGQILASCQAIRSAESSTKLPTKMDLWQSAAKNDRPVDLQTFSMSQKAQLYEWLTRLELTSDFSQCQQQLAATVWNMMVSLTKPEYNTFKASFFNQLSVSLENCQDRAAMTLNTLYTTWKFECNRSGSERETLSIMAGLAKTLTLRETVADKITAMEKAGADVSESVQIYLYCETKLRKDLKLTTAIENMAYADFTERSVLTPINNKYGISIDLSEFKKTVERDYPATMKDFPKVEALWQADKKAQQSYKQRSEGTRNEIKALDEKMEEQDELKAKGLLVENKLSEDDYHNQGTALRKALEDIKSESIIEWIKKKL